MDQDTSHEIVVYSESESDPDRIAMIRASTSEAWFFVLSGVIVIVLIAVPMGFRTSAGVIALVGLVAWTALGIYRLLLIKKLVPNRVSNSRIIGQGLPPEGLRLEDIEAVESKRTDSDEGAFIFSLRDGSRHKVRAGDLVRPDEYWGSLKRVLPRASGWEQTEGSHPSR